MAETAWALLVVSSDKQSETLPHQDAWARSVASEKGWSITRTFEDVASGKSGPRKLVRKLLAELESLTPKDRPQWVLMIRIDRVGRGSIVESQVVVHELKKLGVRVWTRDAGEVKLDSAMDELIVAVQSAVARHENEVRAEKSQAAHARKRREGKHAGHAPYGVVLLSGKPVAYEPEAAVVREIFKLRLQGWGYHRLSRYAMEHAPPKRRPNGGFREIRWNESTIGRMLLTPTHRGITVPEDLFDAVQGLKHSPMDRTAKYRWPLRGAVRCSCGRLLSVSFSGPKRHRIRYYTCRYAAGHKTYPYHRADVLEAAFLEKLEQLAREPLILTEPMVDVEELRRQRDGFHAERASIEARKRLAWELAEQGGISPADLRERIMEIGANQQRLDAEIKRLDAEIGAEVSLRETRESTAQTLEQMREAWAYADAEMQREMAKAVAEYVGGLYALPPERASATRLLDGGQFRALGDPQ